MQKKLIEESKWMKVYATQGELLYESKLLENGPQISGREIKARWKTLSEHERLEFAIAFSAKEVWQDEDQKVLSFLMRVGDESTIQMLADLIATRCEKKRALSYLLAAT
jgi:hypothetical protein